MRFCALICAVLSLGAFGLGAEKPRPAPAPVTVPAVIDHNRVVIDAEIPLPDGSSHPVHAWVDNGNPDLHLSRRLATLLTLNVSCGDKECSAPPPREIVIGSLTIPFSAVNEAHIPLKPVAAASVLAAGMNVDINIPSTVLRQYDVLIDFPGHKFTIGPPGAIHFLGSSSKVLINAHNGLIQVPTRIENKKHTLALDVGSCISFLSDDVFSALAAAHPDWPHMTGAVGSANMWGMEEETKWKLMRIDRVEYGPLFLTNVAFVALPEAARQFMEQRAGMPSGGLLGSNVLLNYRVGLDYAHSTVYFDIGRLFNFPDFDVVGLTLRPEDDGQFTILGVADLNGQPSVPSGSAGVQPGDRLVAIENVPVRGATMGQVWSMLGGTPGQERKLTIEHEGRRFVVTAKVQHFLGETEDNDDKKGKSRGN